MQTNPELTPEKLRTNITRMLRSQGYEIGNGLIRLPQAATKDDLRRINQMACAHRIASAEPVFARLEDKLIRRIAAGEEVVPERIKPRLVRVDGESEDSLLFRYATLHWSIPVSSGYGRRMRFLVVDESNGKLIGLFGLGDPVYAIKARDEWIGWDSETKKQRLYHVMDAYVLGAVPPYSMLLGGKLVALMTLSNEVRQIFTQKYGGTRTLIHNQSKPPWLVLLTTTSALGRSSIYNRVRLDGYNFWRSVGFTSGSGEFHFSNGIYQQMIAFGQMNCQPTAKSPSWGKGFRNRRELIKKCLASIGLSTNLLYHGIRREIFVAPLAQNALEFLRGEVRDPDFWDWPADEIAQRFLKRWLLPRAERMPEYRSFRRDMYRIW